MLTAVALYIRQHHIGLLALFIALSGTAYAATRPPRNSVGTAQLKNGAVTSPKVRDRSLRARDFARGQLPRGPVGPQGERGPAGSDAQFNGAAAGGDLTGTFPNPQIAQNVLGTEEAIDNGLTGADVDEASLDESQLDVVQGPGQRVTFNDRVNSNGAPTLRRQIVTLPDYGSITSFCTAPGPGSVGVDFRYTNLSGEVQRLVAMTSDQNSTAVTMDGNSLAAGASQDFDFPVSSTNDLGRRLELQVGSNSGSEAATFRVTALTDVDGGSQCHVLGEAIG